MRSRRENGQDWVERECQKSMVEMAAFCPWMSEEEVLLLRQVFTVHFGLVAGEVVDLGLLAGNVAILAQRAERAEDRRRQWAFEQWYEWACAALRGEEYEQPEMPEELAVLP